MKKLKKIARIILWLFVIGVFIAGLIYAHKKSEKHLLSNIHINFENTPLFLNKKTILEALKNKGATPGDTLKNIDVFKIERSVKQNPYVETINVHKRLSGDLFIDLKERTAIARLKNNSFDGFLDLTGKVLPRSKSYVPRLIVISGSIDSVFIHNAPLITQEKNKINPKRKDLFLRLFRFIRDIYQDPFWSAQISQIHINKDKTIEITTLMGNQHIRFGSIEALSHKLRKLELLYQKGFVNTGWDKYQTIDLQYQGQIVCKKTHE